MNSFINTFIEIVNRFSESTLPRVSEETLELYKITFQAPYETIRTLIEDYKSAAFDNSLVSLTFQDQSQHMLYDNFIRVAPLLYKGKDDHLISIEMTINKKKAFGLTLNEFVFIEMDSFKSNFNFNNEKLYSKIIKQELVRVYLPIDVEIRNEYLLLNPLLTSNNRTNFDLSKEAAAEFERILKIRDDSCRLSSDMFIPELFLINGPDNDLKLWFDKNLLGISLCHIGNKLMEDNIVVLRGSKNIEIDLCDDFIANNAKCIYDIFKFSYEEKHNTDKIEISRNVITIYLNTSEGAKKLNELAPTIEKTIRSHFAAYIDNSIKKFFNDRKDVIKEAHKFASDIKGGSDKLMTYINASLIGIVTAIFAGSLGLSKGERWFLLLAFGLHVIAFLGTYLANSKFVRKRLEDIEKIYDEYTSKFVVLAEEELEDIKRIYIEPSIKNVKGYLKTYRRVTIGVTIFMIILIGIGLYLPNTFFDGNVTPKDVFKMI
ncbi:hypothetical protein HQN89_02080 [Paenibacillus frigoriresistens]|uniref:hypothetical protein n=1 Tax=Paenibacillus alginolyticus TaxID=59839 RepID=UPI001564053D|nr:hypothetical protein [Paenibacillus frigoriresistens]NRF89827.1 hypothetical protein [Paenibacillus frigoriresistens]